MVARTAPHCSQMSSPGLTDAWQFGQASIGLLDTPGIVLEMTVPVCAAIFGESTTPQFSQISSFVLIGCPQFGQVAVAIKILRTQAHPLGGGWVPDTHFSWWERSYSEYPCLSIGPDRSIRSQEIASFSHYLLKNSFIPTCSEKLSWHVGTMQNRSSPIHAASFPMGLLLWKVRPPELDCDWMILLRLLVSVLLQ